MAVQRVVRNLGIIVFLGVAIICIGVFALFKSFSNHVQIRHNLAVTEAEISSLEVALVAIQADTGVRTLRAIFDEDALERACDLEMQRSGTDIVAATIKVHSTIALALIEHGNQTADILAASDDTKHLAALVPQPILSQLGSSYMDDAPFNDPWENPFRVFFGPWPETFGTITFRSYRAYTLQPEIDQLVLTLPNSGNTVEQVGFPASTTESFYIWSLGQNETNDQALFDPTGEYASPPTQHSARTEPSTSQPQSARSAAYPPPSKCHPPASASTYHSTYASSPPQAARPCADRSWLRCPLPSLRTFNLEISQSDANANPVGMNRSPI